MMSLVEPPASVGIMDELGDRKESPGGEDGEGGFSHSDSPGAESGGSGGSVGGVVSEHHNSTDVELPSVGPQATPSPLLELDMEGADDDMMGSPGACPYCHQTYRQPRVLQCLHALCEDCIIALLEGHGNVEGEEKGKEDLLGGELEAKSTTENKPPPGVIRCPVCATDSQVGNDARFAQFLLMDYVTVNLLDAAAIDKAQIACESCKTKDNAVARCQDCANFLCPNCVQAHQYMRCFEGHNVVGFDEIKRAQESGEGVYIHRPIHCPDHRSEIYRFYCATCQVPVCNECVMSNHKPPDHRSQKIDDKEIGNSIKDQLKTVIKAGEEQANFCQKAAQECENKLSELKERVESSRETINEAFDAYRMLLEERRQTCLEELESLQDHHEENITNVTRTMGNTAEKIEDACRFTNRLVQHGNTMELLVSQKPILHQLSHLLHSVPNVNAPVNLHFIYTKEEFKEGAKKFCGMFTSDLLQPNPIRHGGSGDQNWRSTVDQLVRQISQPPPSVDYAEMMRNPPQPNAYRPLQTSPPRDNSYPQGQQGRVGYGVPYGIQGGPMQMSQQQQQQQAPYSMPDYGGQQQQGISGGGQTPSDGMDVMANNLLSLAGLNMSSNDAAPHMDRAPPLSYGYAQMDGMGDHMGIQRSSTGTSNGTHSGMGPPNNFGNLSHQSSFFQSRASSFANSEGTPPTSFPPHQIRSGGPTPLPNQQAHNHQGPGFQNSHGFNPPASGTGSGRSSATPMDNYSSAFGLGYSHFGAAGNLPSQASAFGGLTTSSTPPSEMDLYGNPSLQQGFPNPAGGLIVNAQQGLGSNPPIRQGKMNTMQIRSKFGSLGPAHSQFNSPHGFCLGFDEDVVVADTNNHRIQIFAKDGTFKMSFGVAGKEEGQLWYPRKVAVVRGPDQKYIVCDRGNERSRMQIFSKNGDYLRKIAIRYVDIVAGLAVDSQGHIVTVDSVSPTVFRLDEGGELHKWFDCSDYMKEPSDIAVSGSEYFICDFKGHCVCVFSDEGQFLRRIGSDNITSFPNGIDISDHGDVLIGDSHGNRFHVSIFKKSGEFQTEFECPYVKVSRCCGLRITSEGYVVTLAKNNHHVLVLNTLYVQ